MSIDDIQIAAVKCSFAFGERKIGPPKDEECSFAEALTNLTANLVVMIVRDH
jgi:hypothetical protein